MANCPPRNQCKAPPSPKPSKQPEEAVKPKSHYEQRSIIENPLKHIGPKQIAQLKPFIPSAITWSAFGLIAGLYFSEWKAVNRFIPFYGGKYQADKETPPSLAKESKESSEESASESGGNNDRESGGHHDSESEEGAGDDHSKKHTAAAAAAAAAAVTAAADGKEEKKKKLMMNVKLWYKENLVLKIACLDFCESISNIT